MSKEPGALHVVINERAEIAQFVEITESQNVTLGQSLANSLWPEFEAHLAAKPGRPAAELVSSPEFQQLDRKVRDLVQSLPVLRVKIYNLDGTTVYSTAASQIGESRANRPAFQSAKSGHPMSMLATKDSFGSIGGQVYNRKIVESYLPIRAGGSTVRGVFEIYADVTPLVSAIERNTITTGGAVILSFLILFGGLVLVVRRAERLSQGEFAELENSQDALTSLHNITAKFGRSSTETIEEIIKLGSELFDLPMGVVGRVEGNEFVVEHLLGPDGAPLVGTVFPLADTFCQHALAADQPVAIQNVSDSELAGQSCHETLGFEAYVGTPIYVDGAPFGTLCFAGLVPRSGPFRDHEISLIQLFATWIGGEIERGRAREASKENEQLFQAIVENAADAIFIHDESGHLVEANESACTCLGYTRDELLRLSVNDLDENFNLEIAQASWRRISEGGWFSHEGVYRRKDGTTFSVDLRVNGVSWHGRGAFIAVARDVTEQRQAEEALRNSEQKFRTVTNNAADAIFVHDLQGNFVEVNESACSALGYTREEIMAKHVSEIEVGNTAEDFENIFASLSTERAKTFNGIQRRKDGSKFPVEARISLANWDGAQNVVVISRDVTERQDAEFALVEAKNAAKGANLAKSQFLASASHDLRQPLQAINLFIAVLKNSKNEEKRQETINRLQGSVDVLGGLLNALLDVSKLEAGLVVPETECFPISALFEFEDEFRSIAKSNNIEFRLVPSNFMVQSDPRLLESVLRNLVSNAVKYTVTGKVLVGCRRRGNNLRIEVHDTGIGITAQQQTRIFEEFYQVGNESRDREKGLGLGLSIVQRTAKLLNHPVSVISEPGQGSAFFVEVPLTIQPNHAAAADAEATRPAQPRDMLVVIIDDDPAVLDGMQALLTSLDCRVVSSCYSDDPAVEDAKLVERCPHKPDIIIADYRLPGGISGVDVVGSLRGHWDSSVPAIILTGEISKDFLRNTQQDEFHVLHKPINAEQLFLAIEDALAAQQSLSQGTDATVIPFRNERVA